MQPAVGAYGNGDATPSLRLTAYGLRSPGLLSPGARLSSSRRGKPFNSFNVPNGLAIASELA